MPFGLPRASVAIRSLLSVPGEIEGLRADVRSLQAQVQTMSTAQDQVTADIALVKSEVATMAANYTAAAAAAQTKALADAQAAWQANDDAAWTAAHAQLTDVVNAMSAGQAITPPATAADPTQTRRRACARRFDGHTERAEHRPRRRAGACDHRRRPRRELMQRLKQGSPALGRALLFATATLQCASRNVSRRGLEVHS